MGGRRTFGTVRKLSSGKWQAMYTDPVSGRRVAAPATFLTKADAARWLSDVETRLSEGSYHDPRVGRIQFGVYAESWLEAKKALRPKTRQLYSYLLRVHLLPTFGGVALNAITTPMIRSWHSQLVTGRGLSATSAAKAYRLLRQILASAVDDGLLVTNPARLRGAATERSKEREIPTLDQVEALADATNPRFRAMVLTAALGGLRLGECLGLARRHVDLDAAPPTLTVERAQVELAGGEIVYQPPKTDAGHRTIALPDSLATALAEHLDGFVDDDADALLFTGARSGRSPSRATWRRMWRDGCEQAGVDCTFHDLRHVAGTLNAAAGATLKEAMARLGHSTPEAALRYQHAVKSRDAEVAAGIERLLRDS